MVKIAQVATKDMNRKVQMLKRRTKFAPAGGTPDADVGVSVAWRPMTAPKSMIAPEKRVKRARRPRTMVVRMRPIGRFMNGDSIAMGLRSARNCFRKARALLH